MTLKWACLVLGAFSVLTVGCDGATEDDDDELAGGYDGFMRASARALCEQLFRCTTGADAPSSKAIFGTVTQCENAVIEYYESSDNTRDRKRLLADGAHSYDADAAAACLATASTCEPSDELLCREVIEGAVAAGGPCIREADCAGDSFCRRDFGCPGSCEPRKPSGSACSGDDECADEAGFTYCNFDAGVEPFCTSLPVAALAGAGANCTVDLAPAPTELVGCAAGLWCDAETRTCRGPVPGGGACTSDDTLCAEGHLCDGATCVAYTIVGRAGGACDRESLVVCDPLLGLLCVDGVCQGSGDGSAGASCFRSDYQPPCNPGLFCLVPENEEGLRQGVCARLIADGLACSSSNECESGTCNAGVCAGDPCQY